MATQNSAALKQARSGGAAPRAGARCPLPVPMTFDDRQQAGQRGAAKEVIFPGFRPDGNGERRAVFTVCEFQNRTSQKSWET